MEKDKNLITNSVSPWNYEESVKQCKGLVGKYNKLSLEIVRELYAANQALSCSGLRSDLEKNCISDGSNGNLVPNGTRLKTFQDYLSDIGLAKRTAYNWMILYIPEEDRLMSTEEFKQRLIEHYDALIAQLDPRYPDFRPEGWNKQVEAYYQKQLKIAQLQALAEKPLEDFINPQPSLFDDSFYDSLKMPTADEVIHFNQLSNKVDTLVVPGVDKHSQVKALSLIESTVRQFDVVDRKNVIRFLASALLDVLMKDDELITDNIFEG